MTRLNNRLLSTGTRWVKNGDQWEVTAAHRDGSMGVKRAVGGGEVVLPTDYVCKHVELGYASTAHRAQGRAVDTAHSGEVDLADEAIRLTRQVRSMTDDAEVSGLLALMLLHRARRTARTTVDGMWGAKTLSRGASA